MSLFRQLEPEDAAAANAPLAERMRPRTLEEFVGQQELLGPGKPLRVAIERDELGSMILWGPPGCGKTTLARLIARRTHSEFVAFSAVLSGIREIKDVMAAAEHVPPRRTPHHRLRGRSASLQQSPAGRLPAARRSRQHHLHRRHHGKSLLRDHRAAALAHARLRPASADHRRDCSSCCAAPWPITERGLGSEKIDVADGVLERIATFANGDARAAYNTLEALVPRRAAAPMAAAHITEELLSSNAATQIPALRQIRRGALQPHLRAAQIRAQFRCRRRALLARAHARIRRGAALPRAAPGAHGQRRHRPRRSQARWASPSPPCKPPISWACPKAIWRSPKPPSISRSLPNQTRSTPATAKSQSDLQTTAAEPVPLHLRNAVTGLMKHEGYGARLPIRPRRARKSRRTCTCLPESLAGRRYYQPTDQGFEQRLRARMEEIRKIQSRQTEKPK